MEMSKHRMCLHASQIVACKTFKKDLENQDQMETKTIAVAGVALADVRVI